MNQRTGHRWPDGSLYHERVPKGWREWTDTFGAVHHLSADGWCWEHSGDRPAYCDRIYAAPPLAPVTE